MWSEEETMLIFEGLVKWWNEDKKYLKKEESSALFGTTANEFKKRFARL